MPARRGPGKCYSISRDDLDAFKAAYPELLGNADHNANTQSNG
jgi:hypothetical protein